MEKRLLYAIVLCIAILFGWNWVAARLWPPPPKPVAGQARAGTGDPPRQGSAPAVPWTAPGQPGAPPAPPAPSEHPAKSIDVESARLSAKVSSSGGGSLEKLDVWGCLHHVPRDRSVQGDPGIVTSHVPGRAGFLAVDVSGQDLAGIAVADWKLEEVAGDGGAIGTVATIERGGLRITATLKLSEDPAHPYHCVREVVVENVDGKPGVRRALEIAGPWTPVHPQNLIPEDGVIVAAVGADPEQLQPADIAASLAEDAGYAHNSETGWRYVGVRSDFYLSAILPAPGTQLPMGTTVGFRAAKLKDPVTAGLWLDTAAASFRIPFETPAAGERVTFKFLVYAGPNSRDVLAADGSPYLPLEDAFPNRKFLFLRFGWMSRFMGWLLSILAESVGLGWGAAVCALTILVRGALFPLSRKTQVSMRIHAKKMAALKPKLDAIKAKYADNPKKQQEMTMKAFREDKVSILPGGCLLAFLQMPVWISLYGTLQTTFEMRHASFLWFHDLTSADHLLHIKALEGVWGVGSFTGGWINLLPLLMMVTWWGSAAMQPLPEDPDQRAQAKMMRWIPVLFGVMLYTTASGLTLYMTLSALWSIGETWFIKKVWISKLDLAPAKAG